EGNFALVALVGVPDPEAVGAIAAGDERVDAVGAELGARVAAIGAIPADAVVAGAADEDVGPQAAEEVVVTGAADDHVVARLPLQPVAVGAAVDPVVANAGDELVFARAARDVVVAVAGVDPVAVHHARLLLDDDGGLVRDQGAAVAGRIPRHDPAIGFRAVGDGDAIGA